MSEKQDNLLGKENVHEEERNTESTSIQQTRNDMSVSENQDATEYSDTIRQDATEMAVSGPLGESVITISEPQTMAVESDEIESDMEANPNALIRRVRTEPRELTPVAQKDKGLLYSFLDTMRFISLGLVIGILLVVFVVQRNDVFGSSMEPNLHQEDAVFVEMISKYFTDYKKGYIVTIEAAGMEGYSQKEKIIKRVIGTPGDTVEIKDGSVYINGVLLDESSYLPAGVPTNMTADGTAKGYNLVTLEPGEYYCMGDNRGASLDSRVLGPFPESRIKSHVIAKIFPFDDMELL